MIFHKRKQNALIGGGKDRNILDDENINGHRQDGDAQKHEFQTEPGQVISNGEGEDMAGVQGLERVDGKLAVGLPSLGDLLEFCSDCVLQSAESAVRLRGRGFRV